MKIKWTMGIGYQTKKTGMVIIDDEDLEGKTKQEIEEIIDEAVWEDAVQNVDIGWDIVE